MIKIIDKDFQLFSKFKEFCKISSFGTRIYSHFLCYGYELDFVDFWVQLDDNSNIICAFCRLDGDFIVCLSDYSDYDEVSAFLDFQEKLSVTFDDRYSDKITTSFKCCSQGDILMFKGTDKKLIEYELVLPQLKEYHELLLTCESDDFYVPQYMSFLSDVARRQNKEMCTIYAIMSEDTLASCAMTVSQTDFSVILGAVATHPQHRKHGYAGYIVSQLAQSFSHLESVYIYTTIERNTRFYEGIGFEVCGRWTKLLMEDKD